MYNCSLTVRNKRICYGITDRFRVTHTWAYYRKLSLTVTLLLCLRLGIGVILAGYERYAYPYFLKSGGTVPLPQF